MVVHMAELDISATLLSHCSRMSILFSSQLEIVVLIGTSRGLEAVSAPHSVNVAPYQALIQSAIRVGHLARIQAASELLSDALAMQLQLLDLLENLAEVFEQDVRFLAIQDVVVTHNCA